MKVNDEDNLIVELMAGEPQNLEKISVTHTSLGGYEGD
jgi:hypothetical protein